MECSNPSRSQGYIHITKSDICNHSIFKATSLPLAGQVKPDDLKSNLLGILQKQDLM